MADFKDVSGSTWNGIDFSDLVNLKAISILHVRETEASLIPTIKDGLHDYEYTKAGTYGIKRTKLEILVRTPTPVDYDFLSRILHSTLKKNPKVDIKEMSYAKHTLLLLYNLDDFECSYHPELNIHSMGMPNACPACGRQVTDGMMHP